MEKIWYEYIRYLAKGDKRDTKVIERSLSDPRHIRWPEDLERLSEARSKILGLLPERQRALLDLSILTYILLRPHLVPQSLPWCQAMDIASLLPGIRWDAITKCRWQYVPVAVVQGRGTGMMIFFVVGSVSPAASVSARFPNWAKGFLDESACRAIEETLSIVQSQYTDRDQSLYIYPLCPPSDTPSIRGPSMCLPIALGATAVLKGQAMNPDLLATGDVCGKGGQIQIGAVGRVEAKATLALREKFSLFMYPAANEPLSDLPSGLEYRAISDLDQAWRWATLYTPGQANKLAVLDTALQGAESFVANCKDLDLPLLSWAKERGLLTGYIDQVLESGELISRLVDSLRYCLYETRDLKRAKVLGALIGPGDALEKMAKVSPLDAFLWCSYNFKRANHFGELDASFLWAEEAKKFIDKAEGADWNVVERFLNSCLVNERHNCFLFRPDLPGYFQEKLDKRIEIQKIQGGPDKFLGRLYGTVVQNYGFCGPEYLPELEEMAVLACGAFGDGNVPNLHRDWQRQFSYLSYAYLDAKKWKEARSALWKYLGVRSWEELDLDGLCSFQHAALVRYMADTWSEPETQGVFQRLKAALYSRLARLRPEHPWQLWAYNLGRLAYLDSDQDKAKCAWNRSIELCNGIAGETTEVMALLPLAEMHKAGMSDQSHAGPVKDILEHIRTSKYLNREHFSPLPDQDWETALSTVAEDPARFFPFTYR